MNPLSHQKPGDFDARCELTEGSEYAEVIQNCTYYKLVSRARQALRRLVQLQQSCKEATLWSQRHPTTYFALCDKRPPTTIIPFALALRNHSW